MRRARKVFAGIAIAGAALALTAGPASANSGNVTAAEDCQSWHASVALANNVTGDRAVDVVSTISGHPGFTGHHYNTSFGEIWTTNGQSPKQGSVTLNIYYPNGKLEFTDSASLTPSENCQPTTSSSSTTLAPATSTSTESGTSSPSTTTCTQPRGCCLSECGPTSATNAGELPKTGSKSLPLAFAGLVSFAAGIALLISFRKQTR